MDSSDPLVDSVSACVGWKGSRVQAVRAELGDERIDIMPWSSFPDRLIKLALAPLHVMRMTLDAEARRAVVMARDPFNPTMTTADRWRSDAERREMASRISGWEIVLTVETDAAG